MKYLRVLCCLGLCAFMSYTGINQLVYSKNADSIEISEDTVLKVTAGAIDVVSSLTLISEEDIEGNAVDSVGTPLEEAVMEGAEVVGTHFEPYTMYVNVSTLNVRCAPHLDDDTIVAKLQINTPVTVIGEYGDIWMIIDYNGEECYISSEFVQETSPEQDTYNNSWTGKKLDSNCGTVNGPSGKETYYNLNMSKCIYYMQCLGYNEQYWVRSDGCKMYGMYIMAAADLHKYPKGSLVESSLGTCIIVDTGDFTTNGSGVTLDIAVTW